MRCSLNGCLNRQTNVIHQWMQRGTRFSDKTIYLVFVGYNIYSICGLCSPYLPLMRLTNKHNCGALVQLVASLLVDDSSQTAIAVEVDVLNKMALQRKIGLFLQLQLDDLRHKNYLKLASFHHVPLGGHGMISTPGFPAGSPHPSSLASSTPS